MAGNHVHAVGHPGKQLNVGGLSEGLYILKLQNTSGQLFIQKFVKQ
jgi:hypothetical protein